MQLSDAELSVRRGLMPTSQSMTDNSLRLLAFKKKKTHLLTSRELCHSFSAIISRGVQTLDKNGGVSIW